MQCLDFVVSMADYVSTAWCFEEFNRLSQAGDFVFINLHPHLKYKLKNFTQGEFTCVALG
jgi:hypothetical protein